MIRNLILFLTTFFLCCSLSSCDTSGIKFALNSDLWRALTKINLNKFAANKNVINATGVHYDSSGIFGYNVFFANCNITNVINPSKVDLVSRQDGNNNLLQIEILNSELDLITDFDIKYTFLFHETGKAVPIKIGLSKILGEFYFNKDQGTIHFTKFNVDIGKIDITFSSGFYNFIYKIFGGIIRSTISKKVSNLQAEVEQGLNAFISSQILFDVGMGIGMNLTNVDRPEMELVTEPSVVKETFLGESLAQTDRTTTVLNFGVHGSLYPNLDPTLRPNVSDAVNMTYLSETAANKVNVLLSDYTLNTLFFMIQQTGAVKFDFTNETNAVFPFPLDVDGLSEFFPEFKNLFEQNFPVEVKMFINALSHIQPTLGTTTQGSKLKLNFGLTCSVVNSTDPFDDPVIVISTDVLSHISVSFNVTGNNLEILIPEAEVDDLYIKVDGLKIGFDLIKKAANSLLKMMLKHYASNIQVDVATTLKSLTNLDYSNLSVKSEDGYTSFSIDVINI